MLNDRALRRFSASDWKAIEIALKAEVAAT
jgi:hypothetical protein